MGPAGGLLPRTVEFEVRAFQEDFEPVQDTNGKWVLEGRGRFARRDVKDALVQPLILEGEGAFAPQALLALRPYRSPRGPSMFL